jgi:ribonucleotide monophosphatase NagD (HAD superfamily)
MSAIVANAVHERTFVRHDVTRLLQFLDSRQADAVVLDLDGTLRAGGQWLEDGQALLEHLSKHQVPFVILTNDASLFGHEKAKNLRGLGAIVDDAQVLTCADLAVATMRSHGWARAQVVGRLGRAPVAGVTLDKAFLRWDQEAGPRVLVLGSGTQLDEELLTGWATSPPEHCLVANCDLVWLPNAEALSPCPGLIARALSCLSESLGQSVQFIECGKPSARAFEAARVRLQQISGTRLTCDRIAVFGDSMHSDIEPARRHGMLAVEAQTGLYKWCPGHRTSRSRGGSGALPAASAENSIARTLQHRTSRS